MLTKDPPRLVFCGVQTTFQPQPLFSSCIACATSAILVQIKAKLTTSAAPSSFLSHYYSPMECLFLTVGERTVS